METDKPYCPLLLWQAESGFAGVVPWKSAEGRDRPQSNTTGSTFANRTFDGRQDWRIAAAGRSVNRFGVCRCPLATAPNAATSSPGRPRSRPLNRTPSRPGCGGLLRSGVRTNGQAARKRHRQINNRPPLLPRKPTPNRRQLNKPGILRLRKNVRALIRALTAVFNVCPCFAAQVRVLYRPFLMLSPVENGGAVRSKMAALGMGAIPG
jgi:hypothetical protein